MKQIYEFLQKRKIDKIIPDTNFDNVVHSDEKYEKAFNELGGMENKLYADELDIDWNDVYSMLEEYENILFDNGISVNEHIISMLKDKVFGWSNLRKDLYVAFKQRIKTFINGNIPAHRSGLSTPHIKILYIVANYFVNSNKNSKYNDIANNVLNDICYPALS